MRFLQRITVILFLLVTLLFVGTKVYIARTVDRTPPVFTCENDVISVPVGTPQQQLLQGLTAADDRDGDLSDQIMIKGVTKLITADTARVTYVVFDSSSNMATYQRTLQYTNYEKPKLTLKQPLVFPIGSRISVLELLTAHDVVDGDVSNKIRVSSQNVNTSSQGIYSITVQVTNSLGDTESIPLSLTISNLAHDTLPVTLSDYIVYLDKGTPFQPASFVLTPAAVGDVVIDSDVNPDTPGIYEVSYTYQNHTAHQTVIVR